MSETGQVCDLCGRMMKQRLTRHHLVPRAVHRKTRYRQRFSPAERQATAAFCGDCHRAVHDLVPDEKDLADHYYTLARLQAHPALARFLTWVRKQK